MRSLLEERFGPKVHFETQTVPAWAMTLVKPGKLGPKLIPVSVGHGCTDSVSSGTSSPDAKPVLQLCGSYSLHRSANGATVFQSNKTTMALLASSLPTVGVGALGRPVVDRTGLTGDYSVSVEFSIEATRNAMRAEAVPSSADAASEPSPGITFMDAVREQLGLKLESTRAPVQVLVVDHIERPSDN